MQTSLLTPWTVLSGMIPQRKKSALKGKGLLLTPNAKQTMEKDNKFVSRIKRSLKELKNNRTREGRSQYQLLTRSTVGKYAVENNIRRELGMKWEYWMRISQINLLGEGNTLMARSDAMTIY